MIDKVHVFLIPIVDDRYSWRELLKISLLLCDLLELCTTYCFLVLLAIENSSITTSFFDPSQLGDIVVSSSLWEGEPSSPGS